jgi:hypothetical protein
VPGAQLMILKKWREFFRFFQKEENMQRRNFIIPSCITLYSITNVEVTTCDDDTDISSTHKLTEAEP